jgi:DNA end-binding protein Ku
MIEAKVAGDETTKPAAVTAKADVVDLMAALQASVDAAKKSRQSSSEPAAASEEDEKPAKKKPAARKRAPKSA